MYHFFVEPHQIGAEEIRIEGADVNHIRNVLRMKPGEEILISSREGGDYFCRVEELEPEYVSAKILEGKTVVAAIESGRDSIEGTVPEEVKIVPETYENPDIYIGIYERKLSSHVLRLIPQRICRVLVLGRSAALGLPQSR